MAGSGLIEGAAEEGFAARYLSIEGGRKIAAEQTRSRIGLAMVMISLVYAIIAGRLVFLGFLDPAQSVQRFQADAAIVARRPDIVDRNGATLATDINTASLFGEPTRIVDADEAIEQLATVLPDLDLETSYKRLTSGAGFVWLKRELTPGEQNRIQALGIPGIGFRRETRRFYPNGETASHVIGLVNIDNAGIAGIEKYVDDQGLRALQGSGIVDTQPLKPVKLALDLRVQHYVRDELEKGIERYQAIAAGAVVLDANNGEVLALVSLPDYDPNNPVDALKKDRLNRISAGLFEMGSTFKAFTIAMAIDYGKASLQSTFDAATPLRISGHTIRDFHGKNRTLSVPEVFIFSSNIAAARMAQAVGLEGHREFLHRIGLLDRVSFELPEVANPVEPKVWKLINSATIAFGHGVTTTPLQTAVAAAALVNGGKLIPPTLFARSQAEADALAKQVLDPATSDDMRYLMRLNVEKGSGRKAEVTGYRVGGKTGTAEKVVNGRYVNDKRFNAFLAAFPIEKPRYIVLVVIDEPKPEEGKGGATAGSNAAPMVANIIRRSASALGVKPEFGDPVDLVRIAR